KPLRIVADDAIAQRLALHSRRFGRRLAVHAGQRIGDCQKPPRNARIAFRLRHAPQHGRRAVPSYRERYHPRLHRIESMETGNHNPSALGILASQATGSTVLPVRIAAAECARRTFPLTSAAVVAQAAMLLLSRESSWRRWTNERGVLIETFSRSDVAAALAEIIKNKQTGGV